ncbi:MAG: hypothetical protein ABIE22_01330 [archaeon]
MVELNVGKFGGSSNKSRQDLERISKIAGREGLNILVGSAPGKANTNDEKVTDMLIEHSRMSGRGRLDDVVDRFRQLGCKNDMIIYDLFSEIDRLGLKGGAREDAYKSIGEHGTGLVWASSIPGAVFVDPRKIFVFGGDYGNAFILPESEELIIKEIGKVISEGKIAVVPGFYGYDKEGNIKTLPRDGTNLTAAYISQIMKAKILQNFTDQKGVLAADPRIVEDARVIPQITYDELEGLSYHGFNVFQEEALAPLLLGGIKMHLRSAQEYPEKGTIIDISRIHDPNKPIVGVSHKPGFCSISFRKHGMSRQPNVISMVAGVFGRNKIPIAYDAGAINDLSYIVEQSYFSSEGVDIGDVHREIADLMKIPYESIAIEPNLECVAVAGQGMKDREGTLAELTEIMKDNGVNIKFVNHGTLQSCIIFGVNYQDGARTVRAIYDEFIREKAA